MDNSASDRNLSEEDNTSCLEGFIKFCSIFVIIITFPISWIFTFKIVKEYERAVIFRLGRLKDGGVLGPGLFFIIPCMDTIQVVDLRTVSFNVPTQEILTKDSVTVEVDAVVYYNIENPISAVCNVEQDVSSWLVRALLRVILRNKTLLGIHSEREQTAKEMKEYLDATTDPWGIKVERVEVDVTFRMNLMMRKQKKN